ncbi:potassium-transporting ATPase subunit KdpC [Leptolinea tardivitalis]|uniref:Potassium-transporting ATPase KdpC subunit n=1 Tax=Leptolinea tardivitalis TaxID=229920 RepID=A0A0P6X2X1_9CHLR|nr:potassium-transporting ATPase subunit KdpC [Leptolinea tardivitalis]KPL74061.1 hypothetical protein ADM99_02175 [Leptolinea tardivitalis]GAP22704.1 K+-transporting ATPase, C subunit [Leptolinea tardivitalis]
MNWRIVKQSLVFLLSFAILTGLVYPALITGIAQVVFPWQSNGSPVKTAGGETIGLQNIGQSFTGPAYFWSRPSSTEGSPYNAGASGGSNWSALNPKLKEAASQHLMDLEDGNGSISLSVPMDMLTSSASGLDPHISPAAALIQVSRVARARGLTEEQVRNLVYSHIENRDFYLLGEPRVNVLQLNLALDALK